MREECPFCCSTDIGKIPAASIEMYECDSCGNTFDINDIKHHLRNLENGIDSDELELHLEKKYQIKVQG